LSVNKKAVDGCPRLFNTDLDGNGDQRTAGTRAALRAAAYIARPAAMLKIICSMIGFNIIPKSARQRFCGIGLKQTKTVTVC